MGHTQAKHDVLFFLSEVPLFQGLSEEQLQPIYDAMVLRHYRSGETIVHQDDSQSQTFYLIVSGTVNVVVLSPEGKQAILATLSSGEFFGEMSILDGEPRSATVVAEHDCEVYLLHRREFVRILESFPQIAIQMLVTLSGRLRRTNRHINTLSIFSVYGRIADVILQIGEEHGSRVGDCLVINDPPTHQTIAEMAGTSRETVSRVLAQLKQKGCITADRKRLVVLNEKKLFD